MSAPARVPATYFAEHDHDPDPLPYRETEENTMASDDSARTESVDFDDHGTEGFDAEGYGAGTGYVDPGYGRVPYGGPVAGSAGPAGTVVQTTGRPRRFSPVLAFAGISSLVLAAWILLGTPIITQSVAVIGAVTIVVLVGILLIARR